MVHKVSGRENNFVSNGIEAMKSVFVVQHVAREDQPDEDVKFIGAYSSRECAVAATNRLKALPGFCDYPDGFYIDEYALDQDHWTEGFVTER